MRVTRCSAVRGFVLTVLAAGLLGSAAAAGSTSASRISIQTLAAGRFHTCAVTSAGGAKCWGFNQQGEVGDGSQTDQHAPIDVDGLTSGVIAVTAGDYHSCALTTAGGVKCWGLDGHGQLGNGRSGIWPTPVDVTGLQSGVTAIAAGSEHTCALTTAGGVKCWGWNYFGQLGDGSTTEIQYVPVDVVGLQSGVVAIAAGDYHTCAVLSSGAAKCWGDNSQGQLGDGTTTGSNVPVDVSGLSGITAMTAGAGHTCALTTAGVVDCWGWNVYGQVGDGTTTGRDLPTPVSGLTGDVFAISANDVHTCALMRNTVWCWGWNGRGELGDGTVTQRNVPVFVQGLGSGGVKIAAGDTHTCVVTPNDGGTQCWGGNDHGQLGDGTTTERHQPVDVVGFETPKHLELHTAGTGRGSIRTTPPGDDCGRCIYTFDYGTQLTLVAHPHSGSSFSGWRGSCSGRQATCRLNMIANRDVTAVFAPQCRVPRVLGKTLAQARAAIRRAHCSTGKVTRKHVSTRQRGKVIAQSPRPGKRLAHGAKVKLTVGK